MRNGSITYKHYKVRTIYYIYLHVDDVDVAVDDDDNDDDYEEEEDVGDDDNENNVTIYSICLR